MDYSDGIATAAGYQGYSLDPSSQIGVAIFMESESKFIVGNCNKFPNGVMMLPERLERPIKYSFMDHAEAGAVSIAARYGLRLDGATLFMVGMGGPDPIIGPYPCTGCAKSIIGAGIKKIVAKAYKPLPENWIEDLKLSKIMLEEAGIEFIEYRG